MSFVNVDGADELSTLQSFTHVLFVDVVNDMDQCMVSGRYHSLIQCVVCLHRSPMHGIGEIECNIGKKNRILTE